MTWDVLPTLEGGYHCRGSRWSSVSKRRRHLGPIVLSCHHYYSKEYQVIFTFGEDSQVGFNNFNWTEEISSVRLIKLPQKNFKSLTDSGQKFNLKKFTQVSRAGVSYIIALFHSRPLSTSWSKWGSLRNYLRNCTRCCGVAREHGWLATFGQMTNPRLH